MVGQSINRWEWQLIAAGTGHNAARAGREAPAWDPRAPAPAAKHQHKPLEMPKRSEKIGSCIKTLLLFLKYN